MTETLVETREGIIFIGLIDRHPPVGMVPHVKLYFEGDDRAVGVVTTDVRGMSECQAIDAAFQDWLKYGPLPLGAERDIPAAVLEILLTARKERLRGIGPYDRTHRFLRAVDFGPDNLRFILTTDKSDVPPQR